jgi:integrase
VLISKALLGKMRRYWCDYRPVEWFFPGRTPKGPISITSAQKAINAAKEKAGIDKVGGIHSLRHAYATHLLEAGLPVHQLQRLLGHRNIHSTLRYVHWVPNDHQQTSSTDLVAALKVADHD